MMGKTAIPWAERTWNLTRGCTSTSEGCAHCYARAYHHRFEDYRGWRSFDEVVTLPEKMGEPLRWRDPATVFVCSRSDLFHDAVPSGFIETVLATVKDCLLHTFMFLTKRPARMLEFNFPPNAWAGVTIENQQRADERLSDLLNVSAPVHFASCEPLLGQIDHWDEMPDWVIIGAESGRERRPMDPSWVRRIRDDCETAGVPLFYKQGPDAAGKLVAMPALDGRVWSERPGQNRSEGSD